MSEMTPEEREQVLSDLRGWLEAIEPEDDGANGERYARWMEAL